MTMPVVSKAEAIAALQETGEFARKSAVAFSDLRDRCSLLEAAIKHNASDPINTNHIDMFETLMNEWDAVAKELLK